jgi:hypothetical protein
MIEAIVGEISSHVKRLIDKWGQENTPPPPSVYSLENRQDGNLHVIQKTFQGDFEVPPALLSY